jgi:hypothetical protein
MVSLIRYAVGALLRTLPWMLIFEWTFRLLGSGLLGPHMYYVELPQVAKRG